MQLSEPGGQIPDVVRHHSRTQHAQATTAGPIFACGEDISHESADAPLPDAIVKGDEPFFIMGAIAGG